MLTFEPGLPEPPKPNCIAPLECRACCWPLLICAGLPVVPAASILTAADADSTGAAVPSSILTRIVLKLLPLPLP